MGDLHQLMAEWRGADWRGRASLAIEIGRHGTAEAEGFLRNALSDHDETYFARGFAALSLSDAKTLESVELLSAKLNRFVIFQCDSSEFVRAKCAHALGSNAERIKAMGKVARDGALNALRSALDDESSFVIEEAIPALGAFLDRESVPAMYRASESLEIAGMGACGDVLEEVTVQGRKVGLKRNVDYQPLALAMARMGVTEPHAAVVYRVVLIGCPIREKAEAALGRIEELYRREPAMDRDGRLSAAIRTCKAKMALDDSAKGSESVVDSVLGRITKPTYKSERGMFPPPLPGKGPVKLKLG